MVERGKEGRKFNQIQQEVKINQTHSQSRDRAYYRENTSDNELKKMFFIYLTVWKTSGY